MPSFDNPDAIRTNMSRQTVIQLGVDALSDVGSDLLCKVCIKNGGSCCIGCRYLADGIGCKMRNTSCTAWLCGFLKYLLYATGLLEEWHRFWKQVPGQDYREDFTPPFIFVEGPLHMPNIRTLSEALAADLQELAAESMATGFILTLREKIDRYVDQWELCKNDRKKRIKIERNIQVLTRPFHRFQAELREYRSNGSSME